MEIYLDAFEINETMLDQALFHYICRLILRTNVVYNNAYLTFFAILINSNCKTPFSCCEIQLISNKFREASSCL